MPASQTVPHVHFHVAGTIPGGGTIWGDVDRLPKYETDKIAEQLRPHLPDQVDSRGRAYRQRFAERRGAQDGRGTHNS